MEGISIIICCYNSATKLPVTLEYISKQEITKNIPVELIVVDNNSTDNTEYVAIKIWQQLNSSNEIAFNIIKEYQQGLMHARWAGIQNAKYNYLVFCDDDNLLFPDYCKTCYNILSHNNDIVALGGQSILFNDKDIPKWFLKSQRSYAVGKQKIKDGYTDNLWGAGIAIKKEIFIQFKEYGFHSMLVGRSGENLSSGEDTEICRWITLLGYKMWYTNELKLYHNIEQKRLNNEYLSKLKEGFEASNKIIDFYDKTIYFNKLIKTHPTPIFLSFKLILKWFFRYILTGKKGADFEYLLFQYITSSLISFSKGFSTLSSKFKSNLETSHIFITSPFSIAPIKNNK